MSKSEATSPLQDEAFEVLSNFRRRFIIQRLHEESEPLKLSDLTTSLAVKENGVSADELTSKERKRTYVSLYQTHVPKLADANVVSYDQETGTVSPTPRTSELVTYLHEPSEGRPWALIYGVIGFSGVISYLLIVVNDASSVIGASVGIVLFTVLMLLSLLHYRKVTRTAAK